MRNLILAILLAPLPAIVEQGDHPSLFMSLQRERAQAEKRHDWAQALSLTQRIVSECRDADYIPLHGRWAEIGEFELRLLHLDSAESASKQCLNERPAPNAIFGDDVWKLSAKYTLARVFAARDNYDQALTCVDGYATGFGSGCGNCIRNRKLDADVLRLVWSVERMGGKSAEQRIRALANGQTISKRLARNRLWKTRVIREARLVLAQNLLKTHRRPEGLELLRMLSMGDDVPAYLAKARLNDIQAQSAGDRPNEKDAR